MCSPEGTLFKLDSVKNVPYLSSYDGQMQLTPEQLKQMNTQIWAILHDDNYAVIDANDEESDITNAGGTDDADDSAGARASASSSSSTTAKLQRRAPKLVIDKQSAPRDVSPTPPDADSSKANTKKMIKKYPNAGQRERVKNFVDERDRDNKDAAAIKQEQRS